MNEATTLEELYNDNPNPSPDGTEVRHTQKLSDGISYGTTLDQEADYANNKNLETIYLLDNGGGSETYLVQPEDGNFVFWSDNSFNHVVRFQETSMNTSPIRSVAICSNPDDGVIQLTFASPASWVSEIGTGNSPLTIPMGGTVTVQRLSDGLFRVIGTVTI